MKELKNEIKIEDLPNKDMRLVAESCGVEVALSLLKHMSGVSLYIPKKDIKAALDRYIRDNYTGKNAKELALRFGKSERYIYQVVKS